MANRIIKKYSHFNRALGKQITSKRHYENEMRKQGMVSFEEGQRLADKQKTNSYKPYDKPSDKALSLIRGISQKIPTKGKIKLSGREIDAMKKVGVKF